MLGRDRYMMRAVRGATTVQRDDREEILAATEELLSSMVSENGFFAAQIVSIIFTTTPDLSACFPAEAARRLGWLDTPLMGAAEIAVPGALPRCIRVLMHVNSDLSKRDVCHVYLREARALRPDLTGRGSEE